MEGQNGSGEFSDLDAEDNGSKPHKVAESRDLLRTRSDCCVLAKALSHTTFT